MESSIAQFLLRRSACELPPTSTERSSHPEHCQSQVVFMLPHKQQHQPMIGHDVWASPTLYKSYLLGLLAMIKCSICSYQCDN